MEEEVEEAVKDEVHDENKIKESDVVNEIEEFEENEEIRVGLLLPMKGQNYRIGIPINKSFG